MYWATVGSATLWPSRTRVPFTLKNTTRIVGADLHGDKFDDAVVLAEDGKLCEISNTPYPPHP